MHFQETDGESLNVPTYPYWLARFSGAGDTESIQEHNGGNCIAWDVQVTSEQYGCACKMWYACT